MDYSLSPVEAAAAVALANRNNLAISVFRPTSLQNLIFTDPSKYLLVQGGNRAGKSLCAAVYFAAMALDMSVTLSTGEVVRMRPPSQRGRKLVLYQISYDERHIGQVVHKLLLEPGLFKVVRDPISKQIRAYDPDTDAGMKQLDSKPLIPKQYIKEIAWNVRAEKIFTRILIHDPGTKEELAEIFAFTSKGAPQAGRAVSGVWIDEAIATEGYASEMRARLVDDGDAAGGRENSSWMIWSSWPKSDSQDLINYADMIDKHVADGNHHIGKKVMLTMTGNKFLSRKAVAEFLAGCSSQEEIDARDKGMFTTEAIRMYPLFDKNYHTAYSDPESDDLLAKTLRIRDGIPPNTWTKYLIIDPGTNAPAALLCAVPPPEIGEFYIPYHEIYPGRADAIQLAKMIKRDMPDEKFYQFIIDHRASRQTPMGFGSTIKNEYERAFELAGLTCHLTKGSFLPGCDDPGGRQMIINSWLHPNRTGQPKLRIVTHRCPKLCEQLTKLKKKVVQKEVKDERKQDGQPSDVVDALAYFAGSHPRYIYIKPSLEDASPAFQRYMKKFGQKKDTSLSIGTYY